MLGKDTTDALFIVTISLQRTIKLHVMNMTNQPITSRQGTSQYVHSLGTYSTYLQRDGSS